MENLILKPGRDRSSINRHPWIFSGAVKRLPAAESGEIIRVHSSENELLGYGFYSPNTQIVCRVFEFCNEEKNIDSDYWFNKISNAFDLRKQLINFETTNIFRMLNAEGDFLPGVIIDIYKDVAVVQLLTRGTEMIKENIFNALRKVGFEFILVKTKSTTRLIEEVETQSSWVDKKSEMPIEAIENGFKFLVDSEKGQKTGFFIDQRENRKLLGEFSKGKKVLNTFCYTGGFSLYALAGGAELVHSVDSSKDAIEMLERNISANFPNANHQSFTEDVFDFLKKAETDYDIIILDPPAFAKNARSVENASRGYKNLNLSAFKKIKQGGIIFTFSCSQHITRDLFRKIIFSAAADAKRNVRIIAQLTQPLDHPVSIFHPEGEYLKGLVLVVE